LDLEQQKPKPKGVKYKTTRIRWHVAGGRAAITKITNPQTFTTILTENWFVFSNVSKKLLKSRFYFQISLHPQSHHGRRTLLLAMQSYVLLRPTA
jgi:hypothetical protein